MGNNNLFNYRRADQIENYLKENMDTARVAELQKQAKQSEVQNRDRNIREKLKEALYPAPAKK